MTTITINRAVVEQALEALETAEDHLAKPYSTDASKAITALRAALAQQAEPVEPVAWAYMGIKQDGTEHGPHLVWKPEYMDAMSASKGAKAIPLYTAPPQRKPLSEEEIETEWSLTPQDEKREGVYFARRIERAHGIGEEK